MKKILTVVIISAMIAVCSCGANKDSADNAPAEQKLPKAARPLSRELRPPKQEQSPPSQEQRLLRQEQRPPRLIFFTDMRREQRDRSCL